MRTESVAAKHEIPRELLARWSLVRVPLRVAHVATKGHHVAMKLGPPAAIGVRALKDDVSAILRRVRGGETVTVTDRGEPVALIVPIGSAPQEDVIRHLVAAGRLTWTAGKPAGSARPVVVRGESVADAVVEDRR